MNCLFVKIDDSADYRCTRDGCGRVVRDVTQLPIHAPCRAPGFEHDPPEPPPPPRCSHKGESLRSVECKTCGGSIMLEVFACAKYGEATAERRAPEVAGCCRGCAFFEEA